MFGFQSLHECVGYILGLNILQIARNLAKVVADRGYDYFQFVHKHNVTNNVL